MHKSANCDSIVYHEYLQLSTVTVILPLLLSSISYKQITMTICLLDHAANTHAKSSDSSHVVTK